EANGLLMAPAGYNPSASTLYPLVIAYHGYDEWGLSGTQALINVTKSHFDNLFRRGYGLPASGTTPLPNGKFFVFAPQAPNADWSLGELETTARLIAKIITEHKIDPARIYVTGLSNGGGATWDMMYDYR